MEEVSRERIEEIAKQLHKNDKDWHFHLLTPDCVLNPRDDKHTFVVEDTDENRVFVTYTEERQFGLGEELYELLHQDLDDEESGEEANGELSEKVERIVERADELNQEKIPWHHHTLFPGCVFNEHDQWCILFEDPETGETIEPLYGEEPETDLQAIEKLYYSQEGAK